jgi:cytochrome c-type biogenesis protein CcmH/NrfG
MPAGIGVARGFLDRGDLQAAREQALRLVQDSPDFVEGWLLLCETLLRLGRVDEAQTVLAAAHRIYGTLPDLTLLDGRVAATLGVLPSADHDAR